MRNEDRVLVNVARLTVWSVSLCLLLMGFMLVIVWLPGQPTEPGLPATDPVAKQLWSPPDSTGIPDTPEGDLIRYGRELVAHTAVYLGPSGTVAPISNGMNCQNCHLKAGKKIWGNNYSAVASTYPKFRARSGTIETIERRVNDCLERSLNGKALEEGSRELDAFVAYIRWVGKDVPEHTAPEGCGIKDLPLLKKPADPERGKVVFVAHCARCHGEDGQGMRKEGPEWLYPPLWGPGSFNTGAGIYRLSRMAGYIKMNMPNGVRADSIVLSDEEAWNVAAFIISQPRPQKDLAGDWPDISTKPFDYPFGPYADAFSEVQHKLGPFGPIVAAKEPK
ncbi:MAG: c-type cytochrome [Cyclobacteriaceae bacterium]|nr:c-type cytochrome [Cyclobacteriaceae bacterium]